MNKITGARKTLCTLLLAATSGIHGQSHAEDAVNKIPDVQERINTLTIDANKAQERVMLALTKSDGIDADLAAQYANLQSLCSAKFEFLLQDQKRYTTAEARINLIGSFLALIGSVTAYAPGKTVLMGLGISSSGSGSVSSSVTQLFSKRSTTDAATLSILQAQLNGVFDRYESVDLENDKKGVRRSGILTRGANICLGLTPITSVATEK